MGIPAFYRWLVDRYPLAVVDVVEETPKVVNGVRVPIETTRPNPNGFEFDNLYLDMNGIVHPCFHPIDLPAPKNYDEVFKAVFKYIDRLFSIVRPRKLLYLAIDGVAPRAKMNQQRTRRFRAAKDAADEASERERLSGGIHDSEAGYLATEKLDSNVITPGTEFMKLLSSALRYYVHLRMNSDPGWQGIKVILSDASVPGEGEHKIMSYIRLQRNLPGFDPNTRHCLYGLDADLIMLALATHEIHFSVLREDVSSAGTKFQKGVNDRKRKCKEMGGELCNDNVNDVISMQKFQFLNIWVLRNYLAHVLSIPDKTVEADLERLIDDFVFMCLFVGNDFLPHVPSLEISEGGIDLLLLVYKKEFVRMGGYLTNSFEVNLERVEHFVQALGSHENAIFRKRRELQMQMVMLFRGSSSDVRKGGPRGPGTATNSNVKENGKSPIRLFDNGNYAIDKVNLGEEGCKERYYTVKFEVKTDDNIERIRRHAVLKYIEGICWVMRYYYQGVCSWQWFYPYHYAPFASDFYGLQELEIQFTPGKPFKPFDQLMAVLPAASAHALPKLYRNLMTDPSSAILDFYPTDFELDMNGRRHEWQAVCKLPFIEESRLLSEISKVEPTLTDEEKQRNSLGLDILFVHNSHPLAAKTLSLFELNKDNPKLFEDKVKINPEQSDGMNGYMCILPDKQPASTPTEIFSPVDDMDIIKNNKVISVLYDYPSFHPHITKPPGGVRMPGESVSKQDLKPQPTLWHEKRAKFGRIVSDKRPHPKSISGPSLAKVAHWLVSEYYSPKKISTADGDNQNSINGKDGEKKLSKDCYDPTDRMKCDEPNDNKVKIEKKKKRRRSNIAEQQATTDGVGEPNLNTEDKMKPLVNNGCVNPVDSKCGDPTDNKISKGQRRRRRWQAKAGELGKHHINGEEKTKSQVDGCDDPVDPKCNVPAENKIEEQRATTGRVGSTDNKISYWYPFQITDNKISYWYPFQITDNKIKRSKKRCRTKRAKQQATADGAAEHGINCVDKMKPQVNGFDEPEQKGNISNFAKQQATKDGAGENDINEGEKMKQQSNDGCGDPIAKETEKTKRGRVRKRRRKSQAASNEAMKGTEAEVMATFRIDSAI